MIVGIFVGGRSTRMGGAPKGLLSAPGGDEPIAARLARLCRETIPDAEIVLVGNAAPYVALGLDAIADSPAGVGPLGGLRALIARGAAANVDVVACAADQPYVTGALILRLARHAPESAAVAPRIRGFWQPLFARYSARALPVVDAVLSSGGRRLRDVLDALGDTAAVLPVSESEEPLLDDWDSPSDVHT